MFIFWTFKNAEKKPQRKQECIKNKLKIIEIIDGEQMENAAKSSKPIKSKWISSESLKLATMKMTPSCQVIENGDHDHTKIRTAISLKINTNGYR